MIMLTYMNTSIIRSLIESGMRYRDIDRGIVSVCVCVCERERERKREREREREIRDWSLIH